MAGDAVLVTGASSGIGRATALHLSEQGYDVFATVRDPADGEELAGAAAHGCTSLSLDVTKPETILAAAERIAEKTGGDGLRALVNNAGMPVPGPLEVLPLDDLREELEVNLVGQLAVTQAMLPLLRTGGGRLIFVSSLGGRVAFPFAGAYHASKHALEALGESLRQELDGSGVEVVLVEPGITESRIWEKAAERTRELIAALDPVERARYQDDLDEFAERMGSANEHAADASKVAKTIETAISASSPSARYPVGAQAKLLARARPFIPDRVFDLASTRALRS